MCYNSREATIAFDSMPFCSHHLGGTRNTAHFRYKQRIGKEVYGMADIVISPEAAERLIRSRDAKAALYYLYLLSGGGAGADDTAAVLGPR